MAPDLCSLVRSDHDDLDRALVAMLDPATANQELTNLLEVFLLALAVHVTAETRVLDTLHGRVDPPYALRMLIAQIRCEHAAQQAAADTLLRITPGSAAWYARVLELRVLVLDHTARADLLRWSLQDHVPAEIRRALASEYAVERLRSLGTTSPIATARQLASTTVFN
jgi:hypothetical protein